jgi:hypothetical protein
VYRDYDYRRRPYPTKTCRRVVQKVTHNAPGTVLRVHIPAGAVISLLNLAEICSPHGISLLVRIPFLSGTSGFNNFVSAITSAGGTAHPIDDCSCEEDFYYDPCCR